MVKFIQGGKMRNLIKNIVDTFGIAIPIAFTYDFLEPILLKNTKTGLILYFVFLIVTFFFAFVPKEHLIDENKKNCFEPFLGISIYFNCHSNISFRHYCNDFYKPLHYRNA